MTWRKQPPSEEQSFKALRASLEAGANFWNAGEFYGTPEFNSLTLLNKYFTMYPEDAEKVVLSIKGGLVNMKPNGTPEGVKTSIENCLRLLDGKKSILRRRLTLQVPSSLNNERSILCCHLTSQIP